MQSVRMKALARCRFLDRLHARADGAWLAFFDMYELGAEAGLSAEDVRAVVKYLEQPYRALIERQGDKAVALTVSGVIAAEREDLKPQDEEFPAPLRDRVLALAEALGPTLGDLGFDAESRKEAAADLATLAAQLGSSRPKAAVLRELLNSLHYRVETAPSVAVATPLLPLFARLDEFLSFPARRRQT